jgi:hypothetical protein
MLLVEHNVPDTYQIHVYDTTNSEIMILLWDANQTL